MAPYPKAVCVAFARQGRYYRYKHAAQSIFE